MKQGGVRKVSHSAEPNLVKVIEGDEVFLQLLKDVDADDELCFTYSDYARERFGIPMQEVLNYK